MNAGLCLTYASVFQMLRSAVVVFTALMSVLILKRKLRYGWSEATTRTTYRLSSRIEPTRLFQKKFSLRSLRSHPNFHHCVLTTLPLVALLLGSSRFKGFPLGLHRPRCHGCVRRRIHIHQILLRRHFQVPVFRHARKRPRHCCPGDGCPTDGSRGEGEIGRGAPHRLPT